MNSGTSLQALRGGCSCGSTRYQLHGEPEQVLICHCPDCRRAVGAHAVAWLMIRRDAFSWHEQAPAVYASSPGVLRFFCRQCGTSLAWEGESQAGRIDITVGSLDQPQLLRPTKAVYRRHRLPWSSEI